MFTTRVQTLLVRSTVAALSAVLIGTMVMAAACGRAPTGPSPSRAPGPSPAPPSVVLREGETGAIPGTDLQVTVQRVITSALIDCVAGAPCNLTSFAMLEVKVPTAGARMVDVRLPNPGGGDRASYGGYLIRVPSLQTPSTPGQGWVVTVSAARE